MHLLVILFLVALLLLLLRNVPKNYVLYKKISSMEGFVPNPSYIFGHAWYLWTLGYKMDKIGLEALKSIARMGRTVPYKDLGYAYGWMGNLVTGLPMVVLTRVELVKEVLSSKKYIDKSSIYYVAKPLFGSGLITSEKDIWSKRRKLLNPTFHQLMLQSYVPSMNKQSVKLVAEIKSELERNGSNSVENTTHIISHRIMAMLLETVIDCEEGDIDPQFTVVAEKADGKMCDRLAKPWKLLQWVYNLTEDGKEFNQMVKFLREEGRKLIEKRLSKMRDINDNESIRPALIDALVSEHRFNPKDTTLEDILDEVFTFLAAGWDTTTWTASFTLLMLGLYPEVQEKVYQEINSNVDNINELTMAETMKLKYLECVINESMRLFPLVTLHGRRAETDIQVVVDDKTVTIHKGTQIAFDSELLHRNERYWTDPDRFMPERFLSENSKGRDSYAFFPFSAGPRNCIGKAFGMMEDKIIIAHIINTFKVKSLDPVDKVRMNSQGIARRTYQPLRFQFYPRVKDTI